MLKKFFWYIHIYTTGRRKPGPGKTGQDSQNRMAEQDRQNKAARTGQADQDRQNRAGRTGHPERDRQNGTGRTGKRNGTGRRRIPEQNRQKKKG